MATEKLLAILSKDEKEEKRAEIALQVQQAALQVESDLLAAKTRFNKAESAYNKAIKTLPFNPAAVINAKREIEEAKSIITDLEAIKAELF